MPKRSAGQATPDSQVSADEGISTETTLRKAKKETAGASPGKAKKIPANIKSLIVELVFENCPTSCHASIAEKTGLTLQQVKSQLAGGGRANLRRTVVETVKKGP